MRLAVKGEKGRRYPRKEPAASPCQSTAEASLSLRLPTADYRRPPRQTLQIQSSRLHRDAKWVAEPGSAGGHSDRHLLHESVHAHVRVDRQRLRSRDLRWVTLARKLRAPHLLARRRNNGDRRRRVELRHENEERGGTLSRPASRVGGG